MVDSEVLQEAILGRLYENTASSPFAPFTTDSIVEEAVEELDDDVEDNEIEYALRRLDEEFLIDYSPAINSRGSIHLTPSGVEEYNTTHSTFLKTEN